jgi:transposase-like protein
MKAILVANESRTNVVVEPAGKPLFFGIFQRGRKVYSEAVPNCAKATLQAIIRGKVAPIHSDQWCGYAGLVDFGVQKALSSTTRKQWVFRGKNHINGIKSFWSFAKRRLMKFHGIPQTTFYLHLKECEFRFNYRRENIYDMMSKILRENPLF